MLSRIILGTVPLPLGQPSLIQGREEASCQGPWIPEV
jgi:hypothetical protein